MKESSPKYFKILLIAIILLGAFFRFYKLDWGQNLFAHPDEYHIVISVNQLNFPFQMHPHFFSYGTVVIYPIYFTQLVSENLTAALPIQLMPLNPFLIGRFYSALFGTLAILLIYLISRFLLPPNWSLIAAGLTATTPGLIQQAHFATPESWLICFLLATLWSALKLVQTRRWIYLAIAAIFFGLSLGIKISTIVFWPVIGLGLLLATLPIRFRTIPKLVGLVVTSLLVTTLTLAIVHPYLFLDPEGLRGNLDYESGVATGNPVAFYTRQFIGSIPFLFQLEKILPYALGPALLLTGLMGLALVIFIIAKNLTALTAHRKYLILISASFFLLAIPNGLLFAKWTRFFSPTFPFFAIFATYLIAIFSLVMRQKFGQRLIIASFLALHLLWTISFQSIYIRDDVRWQANRWLVQNTKLTETYLIEEGNTVDLPLTGSFRRLGVFFYDFESNPQIRQKAYTNLEQSDYFLVQSRRLFLNHQNLRHLYPLTARFYDLLFANQLGFKQVAQIDNFPGLTIANFVWKFPDEEAEETWSVFDHPVIRIFKKEQQLSKIDYYRLVEQN